jgi:hypothetical protein
MSSGLKVRPSKTSEDDMQVEYIGLIDQSSNADENEARIRSKIASMIALGLKRGRPRKEENDNEEIAA